MQDYLRIDNWWMLVMKKKQKKVPVVLKSFQA